MRPAKRVFQQDGISVLQQYDPSTGSWKTIRSVDDHYEYGILPYLRELYIGQRKIKWIGLRKGVSNAIFYDSGTDLLS